ncbi:MFS transporter [Streptomyces dangxiongensis]|uniref:MFS transporter n=1 Tax=Streptomyces dangxiongensis TaxID=1442032 RepID=A0A3G2JK14_9ACTN|nr:MFS transporter [Streptomyces dangxiongensis]AYN41961.1 MFS transporter [Streptomyces dangxiongensis]
MTTSWTVVRVLRDRTAGLYLAGAVVSAFGTSSLWLASGVWVKDLTGSDGLAALCPLALWAPTLAGPALGTLADRTRRRPLLVGLELGLAGLLLVLFAVDSPGRVWLLFAVLFLYGAADAVHDAAESALVTAAVGPDLRGDLNGLRMTVTEGMKLVAPLTGAALYAARGGPAVACLDAVTFVLAAGLCALLRVREQPPVRSGDGWRTRTAEGVRQLWGQPELRTLVLAGGTTMLLTSLGSATVYAVVGRLGHSPAYTGVLYAAQGAGSVVAGLLAGPALRRFGEHRCAAAGIALTGASAIARAVPSDSVVLVSGAAAGLGLPCVLVAVLTAVQRRTPGPLLGRVTATAGTLVLAPNVLGLALGAGLVELAGPGLLLPLYGVALLLTAIRTAQRAASASRTASRSPSDANPA